jgi:hypothetical protein
LRVAVMPSQRGEYDRWVANGYWDLRFPSHIRQVVSHREELEDFATRVADPEFIQEALDLVREYWPEETVPEGMPPIAFLFFHMDARGYNPVIIDLYYALDKSRKGGLKELVAHEIHHYYRNKVLDFVYPPDEHPDQVVVHTLNQVHLEGLADQIDKVKSLSNPYYASTNERYHKYLNGTPGDMRKLDSILVLYPDVTDSLKMTVARQIARTTPRSGHPMGYFMTLTMKKVESLDYAMEEIGNPFRFFYRYNEVAKKSVVEVPVFSAQSLETIQDLEERYAIPAMEGDDG